MASTRIGSFVPDPSCDLTPAWVATAGRAAASGDGSGHGGQVLDQHPVESFLGSIVLTTEDGRGVQGGHGLVCPATVTPAAALLHDAKVLAQEGSGGRRAQTHQDLRRDQGQFGLEPWSARADLREPWRLVDAALATFHELEVLHDVGDVEALARQPDFLQGAIEDLAGRTDEGSPLPILLIAWLLTDEHDAGVRGPSAEDGLGRVSIEVASLAAGGGLSEVSERGARRHEGGRARAPAFQPAKPFHQRIRLVTQEIAAVVSDLPQRLVEEGPAIGIGLGGHSTGEVDVASGDTDDRVGVSAGAFDGARVIGKTRQKSLRRGRFHPGHLGRRYAVTQEGTGGHLPVFEGRSDLDALHRLPAARLPHYSSATARFVEDLDRREVSYRRRQPWWRGLASVSEHLVGVISDTHGLLRPEALAALVGCELIIHAGDIGSPEVLARLGGVAPVVAVRGNNDREPWAKALPATEVVDLHGCSLYVLHDVNELDLDPGVAGFGAVIAGHSHRPRIEERAGVLFLNPGSAGPRRFALPITLAHLRIKRQMLTASIIHLDRTERPP